MLGKLGKPELIVVGLVIIILFGYKIIPGFLKGLGKAVGEFKKGVKE